MSGLQEIKVPARQDVASKLLPEIFRIFRVFDTLEDEDSLVSEVWRTFLMAMALLLLGEALLCLPAKREPLPQGVTT